VSQVLHLNRIAPSREPVLLLAETGSGKEISAATSQHARMSAELVRVSDQVRVWADDFDLSGTDYWC